MARLFVIIPVFLIPLISSAHEGHGLESKGWDHYLGAYHLFPLILLVSLSITLWAIRKKQAAAERKKTNRHA